MRTCLLTCLIKHEASAVHEDKIKENNKRAEFLQTKLS